MQIFKRDQLVEGKWYAGIKPASPRELEHGIKHHVGSMAQYRGEDGFWDENITDGEYEITDVMESYDEYIEA